MSKGSIKKNYILNLFYQLLSILTPLVTTPYISRVFGAEAVGEYSYAESIVSYFVLMAVLGTETYAKREISYVQDDVNKRSLIFFNTFILRLVTTATMLIAYFFSAYHKALLLVLAVNIVTVACDITWFFQGLEEFGKIVCRNVLLKLINIIFVFCL
ncbi:membrane protein involved in the export of O-antigen and teichoic acid [Lachnospiraceae bacterium JC7]|nr:membrane protein involved in the export of O-antigen and teichoic acid [Lachnospiraceae bacterium JC7]